MSYTPFGSYPTEGTEGPPGPPGIPGAPGATGPAGSSNLTLPSSTSINNLVTWNNTNGTSLADSGISAAYIVTGPIGPTGSTNAQIAVFNNTTGTELTNSLATINNAGNIVTPGNITATSTIEAGNFSTDGVVTGGSYTSSGPITTTGLITAGTFSCPGLNTLGDLTYTGLGSFAGFTTSAATVFNAATTFNSGVTLTQTLTFPKGMICSGNYGCTAPAYEFTPTSSNLGNATTLWSNSSNNNILQYGSTPVFVTAGTGMTGSGPSINLASTGVSAGSYTQADITVNAQGQITAVSNGGSSDTGNPISTTLTGNSTFTGSIPSVNNTDGIFGCLKFTNSSVTFTGNTASPFISVQKVAYPPSYFFYALIVVNTGSASPYTPVTCQLAIDTTGLVYIYNGLSGGNWSTGTVLNFLGINVVYMI